MYFQYFLAFSYVTKIGVLVADTHTSDVAQCRDTVRSVTFLQSAVKEKLRIFKQHHTECNIYIYI